MDWWTDDIHATDLESLSDGTQQLIKCFSFDFRYPAIVIDFYSFHIILTINVEGKGQQLW